MTEDILRQQVEQELAQWQQKGEFEPMAQWQQRVNETTRAAKAREIANRISGDYNRRVQEARAEYQQKYEALAQEFLKQFRLAEMGQGFSPDFRAIIHAVCPELDFFFNPGADFKIVYVVVFKSDRLHNRFFAAE